jgi:hypothetical protein
MKEEAAMRLVLTSLALLGCAGTALAQERGSFALDAMTTPGRHFGAGYYVTDALSVRPSLGAGYTEQFGMTFDLGADARYELMARHRVSPYLAAGISFSRSPYLTSFDATGAVPDVSSSVTRYGAGVGLRARLGYGLSLVGEGRIMNSELGYVTGGGFYGQEVVRPGAHFEAAVGISYTLN